MKSMKEFDLLLAIFCPSLTLVYYFKQMSKKDTADCPSPWLKKTVGELGWGFVPFVVKKALPDM
jgi:hypothetical protein